MTEPIDDPVLGRLTWDGAAEWYEGEEVEVTRGHQALLFVDPNGPAKDGIAAGLGRARRTLERLRRDERRLRQLAAGALRQRYPDRVKPLSVKQAAEQMWLTAVYLWGDGSARIDWDALQLLRWNSSNWVSHIGPRGGCRKIDWE
jgi:hypothetical protein